MGWTSEKIDWSVKETGIKHTFDSAVNSYIAIAYPAVLGELKHIYQNGLYDFDMIDGFIKTEIVRDGQRLLEYKFPDKMMKGVDIFEFLWKDKKEK